MPTVIMKVSGRVQRKGVDRLHNQCFHGRLHNQRSHGRLHNQCFCGRLHNQYLHGFPPECLLHSEVVTLSSFPDVKIRIRTLHAAANKIGIEKIKPSLFCRPEVLGASVHRPWPEGCPGICK